MLVSDGDAQKPDELRIRNRALEACPDGIIICDALAHDYPIIYVNPAFENLTGYSLAEVVGRNCRFLQQNDHDQADLVKIRYMLHEHEQGIAILRNYRKDGALFWNELHLAPVIDASGRTTHFVGIVIDITSRKRLEEQLVHQATHDTLTNLPNRILLLDRIQQAIIYADRSGLNVALLFFDIDHFKFINDSLGHRMGDVLLQIVGQRLGESVRETDTVSRLGGDEFVVVLSELTSEQSILPVVEKCQEILKQLFILEEAQLTVSSSIGVSIYPKDGKDPETLLKNADIAMYWAKEMGRNNFQFYMPEMNKSTKERLEFESNLRQALSKNEFFLHYQPLFDLRTGAVMGAEALLRWQHPKYGLVAPDNFIRLAEEIGVIVPIGEWVIKTVCKQNKLWQEKGLIPVKVAINVSGQQFKQNFAKLIENVLRETQLDAKYLEVEITENVIESDRAHIIPVLHRLKDMGISLAIDDFGIGYSSLSALKYLPVDKIKIDRSFIQHIGTNSDDTAIVTAIITIAKSLKLTVLAEGVENESQLRFLQTHQCDEVQGFYFSKPLSVEDMTQFLAHPNVR